MLKFKKNIRIYICAISMLMFQNTEAHEHMATKSFKICGKVTKTLKVDAALLARCHQVALGNYPINNHRGEFKDSLKGIKGVLLKSLLDSAGLSLKKPKYYSQIYYKCVAIDKYSNIYSWNELYNTSIGDQVYVITECNGQKIDEQSNAISLISLTDYNKGRRNLHYLKEIKVCR